MLETPYKNWLKPENFLIAAELQNNLNFSHCGDYEELGFDEDFIDIFPIENSDVKIDCDLDNQCLVILIESDIFIYSISFDKYEYDDEDEDSLSQEEAEALINEELDDICLSATSIVTKTIAEYQLKNPPKFVQMCLDVRY